MPLQQLCSATSNKRGASSNTPLIIPALYTQELYDAKMSPQPLEKCASETSTLSYSRDICRICHCEGDSEATLIAPCYCSGSLRYVHQACLQQWIKSSDTKCCELCKFPFIMHSKLKPFQKWQCLEMNGVEKRKVIFSVLFHIIAITCVIWSLYVLIERTSQEVQNGELEWPFWTKLIVVAIGFTGSIVFMYVQCRMYLLLCRRWRAFNRIIYIKNSPEKIVINDIESSRVGSEGADKPFLHLAVISSSANAVTIKGRRNPSGSCDSSASTPPGALWAEETSTLTTPHSSFIQETGNLNLCDENDSLISRTRSASDPSLRGTSECLWRKEGASHKNILPGVHGTHSRVGDSLPSQDSSTRDVEAYCFHILNP